MQTEIQLAGGLLAAALVLGGITVYQYGGWPALCFMLSVACLLAAAWHGSFPIQNPQQSRRHRHKAGIFSRARNEPEKEL